MSHPTLRSVLVPFLFSFFFAGLCAAGPTHPKALVVGSDGVVYGTSGSSPSEPELAWKLTPGGPAALHNFGVRGNLAKMIQGADGHFYIATFGQTVSLVGLFPGKLYRMSASGEVTVLYNTFSPIGIDLLLQGTDGNLYFGYSSTLGSQIFRRTPAGHISTFRTFPPGQFVRALVQGPDAALYGINLDTENSLLLYRLAFDGTYTPLHTFTGVSQSMPLNLVAASDGNLYGTVGLTMFRATTGGVVSPLHTFDSGAGDPPVRNLVQGSDGSLFAFGGNRLVRFALDGTESIAHIFTDGEALSSLAVGPAGMYGTFVSSDSLPGGAVFSFAGGTYSLVQVFGLTPSGDDVPLVGDLDGDGRSDLAVWRRSTGTWYWLTSSSGYSYAASSGRQWGNLVLGDVPMLADMDGDGKADLTVWRASTGTWYWLKSSLRFASGESRQWGNGSLRDVPIAADLDGDGRADLAVWRPDNGTWYWLTSSSGYSSAAARSRQWGNQSLGDVPLLADLDGDRTADLVAWRASTGTWWWLKSTLGLASGDSRQWGNKSMGDMPLVGDIDGDGTSEVAVWRASTGTFWWLTSSTNFKVGGVWQWGNQSLGDVPFLGDMDFDGKADLIVWRASSGTWYWLTSSSGYAYSAARAVQWGKPSAS